MIKKEEVLSKHPYKIWQGTDGNWRTYLSDPDKKNGRKLIKKKEKADVENAIVDYWKEKENNPTIDEIFTEWNDRRLQLNKISNSTYLRNKQFYNRHYNEFGKRRIKTISKDEWEDFLEEQIPKFNLTSKAFGGVKGITRGFLRRAKKRKLIDFNVEELLSDLDTSETDFKKEIKEDYEEVFNEEETEVIIDYLINNLDAANIGILLMFVTGARIGEIVTLKHSDFELNTFKVRRTETRFRDENNNYVLKVKEYPKTRAGVRTVVIPKDFEWICTKIKLLNPFGEYIFINTKGERMSTQSMRMRLKHICCKLNIYPKSPHKIRKTYGTILLDNHIDKRLIMGQMGHTDIICTENHYHRNRRSLDKKTEILSNIPDLQFKIK